MRQTNTKDESEDGSSAKNQITKNKDLWSFIANCNTDLFTMVPFSNISKSWALASWKVSKGSMWVLLLANTIKGCYILLVFQKNQHCSKKMKNPKILKKCKLYFLEIDDFMKIILQIFSKFWPTMKKRAPPDQNWAILNKFIDTIRES